MTALIKMLALWLSLDFGVDVYPYQYLSTGLSVGSDHVPGLSLSGGAATELDGVYPYLSVGYSITLR